MCSGFLLRELVVKTRILSCIVSSCIPLARVVVNRLNGNWSLGETGYGQGEEGAKGSDQDKGAKKGMDHEGELRS